MTTSALEHAAASYLFLYCDDLPAHRTFIEEVLGYRVVEEDETSVKYDAGTVILALNKAPVESAEDYSALFVVHVEDIDESVADLKHHGVEVEEIDRYEIGATATFLSPGGHCFCLYEPSDEAKQWPSFDRIGTSLATAGDRGVGAYPLVYVFMFVTDAGPAAEFFRDRLGLRVIEVDEDEGVVKYDVGTMLVAVHPTGQPMDAKDPRWAISFTCDDIHETRAGLVARGVTVSEPFTSVIGATAVVDAPVQGSLYLYEASDTARTWPSWELITLGQRLLASAEQGRTSAT